MPSKMASDSTNARPPPLSYAERARRAASSSSYPALSKTRLPAPNGVVNAARPVDEPSSPASSSRNLTPSSTAALTLPGSPPPSSSQTSIEEQHTASATKSFSKFTPSNVWTARKEQMARSQQGHASAGAPSEVPSSDSLSPLSTQKTISNARNPPEGAAQTQLPDDLVPGASSKIVDDPFVVRMPSNSSARRLAASSSSSPPSLDDADSWPEMARTLAASSSTAGMGSASSATDLDKREGSSNAQKKSEKPKWVPIPQSELQATHDALVAASNGSSRAQSQQRRGKSRSRRQSRVRPSPNQSSTQVLPTGTSSTSKGVQAPDTSGRQTRAGSSTHSRATSSHSSPHIQSRGRRLPDGVVPPIPNTSTITGPNEIAKTLPNGNSEQSSILFQPTSLSENPLQPQSQDNSNSRISGLSAGAPHSGPHSQTHTPFQSQSPVYYPPMQINPGLPPYGYGMVPPNAMYAPSGGPSPRMSGGQLLSQGYPLYPPYGQPQHLPPGQHTFPYFFPPVQYQFYSPQSQAQPLDRSPEGRNQDTMSRLPSTNFAPTPPPIPPPSATRLPPPDQSAPLSGYREIPTIAVSPLLLASGSQERQRERTGGSESSDVMFGSVGEPGGLKSPSPVLSQIEALAPELREKRHSTSFAVGYDGASSIRLKISGASKDSTEELTEAVKVIDLTDKSPKWEFGTSTSPGGEVSETVEDQEPKTSALGLEATSTTGALQTVVSEQESQLLQPQPQTMLQFPPPPLPLPHQVGGGYPMGPQVHMMPLQQRSPQAPMQPLPHHVPSLAPLPLNPGFVSPLALGSPGPTSVMPNSHMINGDEWEVRDFGYGFGPTSGSGFVPERMREDRFDRDGGYREQQPSREFSGNFGGGRGRRNTSAGPYFEGGRGMSRRGRGGPNGYGRGYGGRGFSSRGGSHGLPRHHQSLSVSTGPFQQQGLGLAQPSQTSPDMANGYYAPSSTTTHYIPSPYSQFIPPPQQMQPQIQTPPQPPMQALSPQPSIRHPIPAPITVLSFPLDPTRRYLLGQVEYYFSLQNLASDFFLRKQMDSRGWLPIHLIASFNRVKQLTQDPQLVRDVLEISSLIELNGDYVRLSNGQWESFVLPGAKPSVVEGETEIATSESQPVQAVNGDEEDEEDDVVFVMGGGGEESRPWKGTV